MQSVWPLYGCKCIHGIIIILLYTYKLNYRLQVLETKIIRAVSEVDYNRLHKRKDQAGTSYIVPSGSDSEELKPLTKKREWAHVVLDSSLPRTKVVATFSTMQLLSEIRSLLGDYH